MVNYALQAAVSRLIGNRAGEVDLPLIFEALEIGFTDWGKIIDQLASSHAKPEIIAETVAVILGAVSPPEQRRFFDILIDLFMNDKYVDLACTDSFIVGALIGVFKALGRMGADYTARWPNLNGALASVIIGGKGVWKYRTFDVSSEHLGQFKTAVSEYAGNNVNAADEIINHINDVHWRPEADGAFTKMTRVGMDAVAYARFKSFGPLVRLQILAERQTHMARAYRHTK